MENWFRVGQIWRMGNFTLQWAETSLRSCLMVIYSSASLPSEDRKGKLTLCTLIVFECLGLHHCAYKPWPIKYKTLLPGTHNGAWIQTITGIYNFEET